MVPDLRNKGLKQFLLWEQLRGIQFNRALMPEDAVDSKLRLIVAVDAANPAIVAGSWAGFRRVDGSYSCQLLLGRALLTGEDDTIPKSELTAYTCGSNMAWLVRQTLNDWIDTFILVGDSVIALCWVSSEKKRLSLFHRNRVIQIRRGTDLDRMFHVGTDHNPADVGTRPDRVTLDDIKQGSKWISGTAWMRGELQDAVDKGILKPISDLSLKTKKEVDDYHDGCVFDQVPEVLTRGHTLNLHRISLIQERASYSQYLLLPTKFSFRRSVRIYSYVFSFVTKLINAVRKRKGLGPRNMAQEGSVKFSAFLVCYEQLGSDHQGVDQVGGTQPDEAEDADTSLWLYLHFAEFSVEQSPPGFFALSQSVESAATELSEML